MTLRQVANLQKFVAIGIAVVEMFLVVDGQDCT